MKAVITGSESFIGNALKNHFRTEGIEFVGIDKVPSNDPGHIQLDICSPLVEEAIPPGTDALIHLAAISTDKACREDPKTAFEVNVGGTLNMIRAAQAREVGQFIFASSEWVYGEVKNDDIQTEDSPIDLNKVISEYALTKLVGERLLSMAHNQGFCPVTLLRFGIVYGPRLTNWSAVESLFHGVRTQDFVTVGSLATARRFVHVVDIARGIACALGRTGFETINLSGNDLITLQDVIKESSKLLGRRPEVRESDPDSASIRNPDNRKAWGTLGWAPTYCLTDGLATLAANSDGR